MILERNELLFPARRGDSCHASQFLLLPNGRLFCVFFCGSAEGQADVRIWGAFRGPENESEKTAETGWPLPPPDQTSTAPLPAALSPSRWTKPTPLTPDDGLPHWNPVLWAREDGAVVLFYKVGRTIPTWRTFFLVSTDACRTWSEPLELVPGDRSGGRGPVRNKILRLPNGVLLAPASTEGTEWRCFFDRSTDGGRTWVRTADLRIPTLSPPASPDAPARGIIQPTLWADRRGVHALMRSTEERLYRTDSTDEGKTWSVPRKTALPNNNSAVDVAMDDNGALYLVCNPVARNFGKRSPLSLFVSVDGGETWDRQADLVSGEAANGYAYPACRCEKGRLHITYTFDRRAIGYLRIRL